MHFRLVYSGELKAAQRDAIDGQLDKLAQHKQSIRRVFHRQLKHLWKKDWFLSGHRVFAADYGMKWSASDHDMRFSPSDDQKVSLAEAVASSHGEYGYRFVPLVRMDWRLKCSLHVLFLRHDPPGSVVSAGDLDNRIKTLIDALRKPANASELMGNEIPLEGEDPFFCLLEDDRLITGFTVESDRYLEPPKGNKDEDRRQVHTVISVDVRPSDVTQFNLSFA